MMNECTIKSVDLYDTSIAIPYDQAFLMKLKEAGAPIIGTTTLRTDPNYMFSRTDDSTTDTIKVRWMKIEEDAIDGKETN
jgi:hypothetical protein